jgi:hypothetical protein
MCIIVVEDIVTLLHSPPFELSVSEKEDVVCWICKDTCITSLLLEFLQDIKGIKRVQLMESMQ